MMFHFKVNLGYIKKKEKWNICFQIEHILFDPVFWQFFLCWWLMEESGIRISL